MQPSRLKSKGGAAPLPAQGLAAESYGSPYCRSWIARGGA